MRKAPAWSVETWFNSPAPIELDALAGKVVVVHAFQMLCPGCVQMALPQAQRIHDSFDRSRVAVIGLHTVFEHHAAMTPVALQAFIHEYRLTFPIGVDRPDSSGPIPQTMGRYGMQGTPTLLLIDTAGNLRKQRFGHEPDLIVGADIAFLLAEAAPANLVASRQGGAAGACSVDGGCN